MLFRAKFSGYKCDSSLDLEYDVIVNTVLEGERKENMDKLGWTVAGQTFGELRCLMT